MVFYLMIFYENLCIPSWDGVSDQFVQPIAEPLTISMIFTIMFTTVNVHYYNVTIMFTTVYVQTYYLFFFVSEILVLKNQWEILHA